MNDEELQNEIKDSIENEKLRSYLLKCLKHENELNSLNLPSFLAEKAKQRFENKINLFKKIEETLPDKLILPGDSFLLGHKFENLRLNLAILYANDTDKISEDICKEIKNFISAILSKNIQFKLKYFDLMIKLLENIIENPQSNKEFTGVLDLLKLFINEPNNHPNKEDLKYVINLEVNNVNKTDILTIKKMFYGITCELNKKLIFQYLLDQLLKIVENFNNSPLTQFCNLFITKCLNDLQMDAIDFNQLIGLVYQALQRFPEPKLIKKGFDGFIKLLNPKKMSEYLGEFEKDFREKIFEQIINEPVKVDLKNNQPNSIIDKTIEFNIFNYFPISIKNKKLQDKFVEAIFEYNQILEKKNTTSSYFTFKIFRKKLEEAGNTVNKITENAKIKIAETVETLEGFAGASADRLMDVIKKKSETSNSQENEEIDEIDLDSPLLESKATLISIKDKLSSWNSILNYPIKPYINQQNQIDTGQINITEVIAAFDASINEKYNSLSLQILAEFEKINTSIKEKDYWLEKPASNKISLVYKIFYRGYFDIDSSIKKIEADLGNARSVDDINNLISEKSFWSLLFNYRIVRWPWLKKNFADTWAQQLWLPYVITQTGELKNLSTDNIVDLVKRIIGLLDVFSPYGKNETIKGILNEVKKYIVAQLNQLERLELKINDCLNERINLAKTPANRNLPSFFAVFDLSGSATGISGQSNPTPILVN